MLGVAVGITWAVLAVYVYGALPKPGAIALGDDVEPLVTVTDLDDSGGRRNEHLHGPDDDYDRDHMHDDHPPHQTQTSLQVAAMT